MTDSLLVEIEVAAEPDHAFRVWTGRPGMWWPASHTISGTGDIIIEGFTGGRIFERAADGTEHDWGEVLDWEPPHRLRCLWHLFFDRSEATDLEVTFDPTASGTTVRIRQTGFERLGAAGEERRTRTHGAWTLILEQYRDGMATPG